MESCRPATHPFFHEVKLTTAQRVKGFVLGCTLVPVRIAMATIFFLIMWPLSRLRTAGLSAEECARPIEGWRRWLFHPVIWLLSRGVFFSLGFLWVEVKGRRADLMEAPVLVVAPHSSFLDMLVLCSTQLATVVSRSENTTLPVIGALLKFNQSVMVSRKDPESRKKAVSQLTERLTSKGYWPQMLMFPEGTTTNGRALIRFKPGAFLAGVPVQPVLLRYPNKPDTVRWTHRGSSWTDALWLTTTQLYTNMTIEFLPVYKPSEAERSDPGLYADNVQRLMAEALGVPFTAYELDVGVPVSKLGGLSLPLESPARETLSLLRGLEACDVEMALERMRDRCGPEARGSKVGVDELASMLGLDDRRAAAVICGLYAKDKMVDARQLYLSVAAVSGSVGFDELLHDAFRLFDAERRGSLGAEELSGLMGALLGLPQHRIGQLHAEASSNRGRLTEGDLLRVLTTHPTYGRVATEYLRPHVHEAPANNNARGANGSAHDHKKLQ